MLGEYYSRYLLNISKLRKGANRYSSGGVGRSLRIRPNNYQKIY